MMSKEMVIFLLLIIPANLTEDPTQTSSTEVDNSKTESTPKSVTDSDSERNDTSTISTTLVTSATTLSDSVNSIEFNSTKSPDTIEPINSCAKPEDIFHRGCSPEIYLDNKWKMLEKCCNDGCFGCSNKPCPFCSDVMTKCIGGFKTDVKEILDYGVETMLKLRINITEESSNATSDKPQDPDKPGDEKDEKSTSLTTQVTQTATEATSKSSTEVPIESPEVRIPKPSEIIESEKKQETS